MKAWNRLLLGLVAVGGLGLAVASCPAQDQAKTDKKGTNTQEPGKGAKASAKSRAMADLELASELIRFGRREKNGESLLLAAQILHKTATRPLNVGHETSGQAGGQGQTAKAGKKMGDNPKELVAEARRMSSSPACEALAMATDKMLQEATRGAANGPASDYFTVQPLQTVRWNPISFRAGERAEVYVNTGSYSNMVLEVTDENGNLVAQDNVPANYYRCVWTPRWTGSFRIRLVNRDNITFNCRLVTN
jgi:hypothetical protein